MSIWLKIFFTGAIMGILLLATYALRRSSYDDPDKFRYTKEADIIACALIISFIACVFSILGAIWTY